jgi:hypothetical protein
MNRPMILRRSAQIDFQWVWRFVPWLAFAVLFAWMLHLCWPSIVTGEDTSTLSVQPVVHWKDAGHDWLLVVDPASHELVVYDAHDGRPLRRLQAVDSITGAGNWVIATSGQHPRLRILSLPDLQPMALVTR